ncbi:MAG: hypothetical protein ACTSPI_01330 [Candidatus Heimdallarchaeaceae archaeon]
MFRFFANKRYFKLFFSIDKKNIKDLSRNHGTVSHLSTVTDQFVKEGLITKEAKGREVEIKLTEDGKKLMKILREFDDFANKQINKIKNRG